MAQGNKSLTRPVRIAGCSGGIYDRKRNIHDIARNENVDFITGDWMSEANMTLRGYDMHGPEKRTALAKGYEPYFLEQFEPAIPYLAEKHIKLCVNAGAGDVAGLALAVRQLLEKHQVDMKVGYVDGDDVTDTFFALYRKVSKTGALIQSAPNATWGGTGVAAAFSGGADIVICGRVADASVTVGAAMYWHGWDRSHLDELAGAVIVGHILECSTYATGGYYSGFKEMKGKDTDLGYPIAAINHKGEAVIEMEQGRDGLINVYTIASQLMYEIQGPLYFNSDVVADISGIQVEQIGDNKVRVWGVSGCTPPNTTKVGITAFGGYQAEFHFYLTGLDISEKAAMVKRQTLKAVGDNLHKFSCLNFSVAGSVPENPDSQDEGTVDLRIFAQTRDPDLLSVRLSRFDAGDRHSTWSGQAFFEYWVSLMPQNVVKEMVHLPDGTVIGIGQPPQTCQYEAGIQESRDTIDPVALSSFGPTSRAPLGYVVMGRSGDKASNCNVGLFVRHDDEWDWLRSLLSTDRLKALLGKDYKGGRIERCEVPGIRAVHFHLIDYLDRGYNSNSGYDILGKNLCEYLRAKHVDVPQKFLNRVEHPNSS
ncbi:hypothetical protein N7451_003094 [Penicillium sp. IBT 35674x]|nr:hypothetical protein N7451_003094 [Penicillium sp. IBT 35674x]